MSVSTKSQMQWLAGGVFSPASLFSNGEQGIWIDPSDFSTMFQDTAGTVPVTAVGQSVARINDKSGRGNYFSQATASRQPLLQQDAEGRYYLRGDGVDDYMLSNTIDPGGATAGQMFLGCRTDTVNTGGPLATTSSVASGGTSAPSVPGSFGCRVSSFGGAVSQGTLRATIAGSWANNTSYVASVLTDIPAPSLKLRVNGAQFGATNTTTQGTGTFTARNGLLFALTTTSSYWAGRVYQGLYRFGPGLTAEQIEQTETFFNEKTGAY